MCYVPAAVGFVRDKAALIGATRKRTHCMRVDTLANRERADRWTHRQQIDV